uniref:EIN3 binding F-box 1 n=1 Tax=Dianthus caryophyllus TaxID=3570 RepID=G1EFI1_DIACA|nr:EIN3 binding F-box 1 [Dianthus caryophyllus]
MSSLCHMFSGEDELYGGRSSNPSAMSHVDVYGPPNKRQRVNAPFVLWGSNPEQNTRSSINVLPDECMFEVFRRLPPQERSNCACVSKQWLTILTGIRRSEMSSTLSVQSSDDVDSCLTRSVEGKKATDVRLAAIAVGTASRGGLRKLSIRGSNVTRGVTDVGLSAVARGCPSLKSLSIWNVSSVSDEGLVEIANECNLLERLDLCLCPSITNKGLIAIAERCPNLVSLSVESCPNIGNDGMQAIAQGCPKLESILIKDCPLVGDQAVASLLSLLTALSKVKLQSLNISEFSLAVIGHYGKSVTNLTLSNLRNVSEKGFWVMGNAQGLKSLVSLSISSCLGVTGLSLEALGKGCSILKQISLRNCSLLSDNGLSAFSNSALSLESMHLEHCNAITLSGLKSMLSNCSSKFRSLSLVKCMGLKDIAIENNLQNPCVSLRSLSIKNCPAFGSASLEILGKMCPNLRQVDLTGLYGMTDDGILALLENCQPGIITKLNLNSCINLSDASVLAIVRLHGESVKELSLDGCRKITDTSLFAIAGNCPLLNDLDVSNCSVTDSGIAALSSSQKLNLQILSISGCTNISNKSLPYLIQLGKRLIGLNLKHCSSLSLSTVDMLVGNLWRCDILC